MFTTLSSTKKQHPELVTLVSLGSLRIVRTKLEEGWDPNVSNHDGISPVLKAAERNDLDMLKLLIDKGARVDVEDMVGFTPLKYATSYKNMDMVELIKKCHKAKTDEAKVMVERESKAERESTPLSEGVSNERKTKKRRKEVQQAKSIKKIEGLKTWFKVRQQRLKQGETEIPVVQETVLAKLPGFERSKRLVGRFLKKDGAKKGIGAKKKKKI